METTPIQMSGMFGKVAEQGALFAFMLLVLIGLCFVIKAMYARTIDQADQQQKILLDSTLAINNNNTALAALTKQVERLADAK